MGRAFPKSSVGVSGAAFLYLALLILLLPLRWVTAAIFAASVHECCHILAVRLCGGRITAFRIGQGGAVLETGALSTGHELICALAGPAGSLLLLAAAQVWPRLALCAFVQGVFNLMPVYPLDGGRVLRCAAIFLLGQARGRKVAACIEGCFRILLFLFVIFLCFHYSLGPLPLLVCMIPLCRAIRRKTPCKERPLAVQ
jgi:stage IV sporulation protein FB